MRVFPSSLTVARSFPGVTATVSTGTGCGQKPAMMAPASTTSPAYGSHRRTSCLPFWRGEFIQNLEWTRDPSSTAQLSFRSFQCAHKVQAIQFAQDQEGANRRGDGYDRYRKSIIGSGKHQRQANGFRIHGPD